MSILFDGCPIAKLAKSKRLVLIYIITHPNGTHKLQFARHHAISFVDMYAWAVNFGVMNAMITQLFCITSLQYSWSSHYANSLKQWSKSHHRNLVHLFARPWRKWLPLTCHDFMDLGLMLYQNLPSAGYRKRAWKSKIKKNRRDTIPITTKINDHTFPLSYWFIRIIRT